MLETVYVLAAHKMDIHLLLEQHRGIQVNCMGGPSFTPMHAAEVARIRPAIRGPSQPRYQA